jgi:Lon protease-like protein
MDLPLFPLKIVLFPQGILPLKVFEKRYVDMVRKCLRTHQGFGIVCVCEDHKNNPIPFSSVGVLVEITETDIPQPGLFNIKCFGKQKFQIKSAKQQEDQFVDWQYRDATRRSQRAITSGFNGQQSLF